MIVTVALIFAIAALLTAIVSAIGKAPLWISVVLLCVAVLLLDGMPGR